MLSIQAFTDLFHQADKDGNGVLTRDEVFRLCKCVGSYTDDEVVKMIEQVDRNKDGKIDLKEFLDALV
ncbi:hypothetical protein KUTeg_008718 [Tegillarca granosa]|uniref:EF-hand domain-containing protein n=1 Tax=Tegillarca granosa TaxID=220873 RepID=A0ABQ9FE87_TEGGR|nr:hypothetical protein KUTeg_008718 [Tegillarca granosa]